MLGTLMYSIYFVLAFPKDYAVTALSSAVFVLDMIYIWMVYRYKDDAVEQNININASA